VLAALLSLLACGDRALPGAPVGVRTAAFTDAVRGRTIPLALWYPTTAGSAERDVVLAEIYPARAVRDAPIAEGGPRPLVLLSHGSGGGSADLWWLAARLARAGFVAAAIEHPGNRFGDDSPEGVVAVWRRPRDASVVLDGLLSDPELGRWIDGGRVGAAGHSSGGYTAIALAGGIYDLGLIAAYCSGEDAGRDCALAGEVDFGAIPDLADASLSHRDERVRAVFAMAPAVGPAFDEHGLAPIAIPVHVVGSVDDELTPFSRHAEHYHRLIPGASLSLVHPGGHFVYLPECNHLGREVAPEVCVDPDSETDRGAVHERIGRRAVAFFRETLGATTRTPPARAIP
jgi:predicted dienelactone hydrolase